MTQSKNSKTSKITLAVVAALLLGLIGGTLAFGVPYYRARYVADDYYARVAPDYPMLPTPIRDMHGAAIGVGYEYHLTATDATGTPKEVDFWVAQPGTDLSRGEVPPEPGQYLLVTASATTVTGWRTIDQGEVPAEALAVLG